MTSTTRVFVVSIDVTVTNHLTLKMTQPADRTLLNNDIPPGFKSFTILVVSKVAV